MSFQLGDGEEVRHGCHYTDLTPDAARTLVRGCEGLGLLDVVLTDRATEARPDLVWVNVFVRRLGA